MRAKWHGAPYHDIATRKWLISFEVEDAPEVFDKTKDKDLTLEVKRYREGRSLTANAYFHKLCDLIAKKMHTSEIESKNLMLSRYGQLDEDVKHIILDDEVDYLKITSLHLRPTSHTKTMDNGKLYRVYLVIRGSHTYDTAEMSDLIDGTVDEAKELGIETLPPIEIERMKAAWSAS